MAPAQHSATTPGSLPVINLPDHTQGDIDSAHERSLSGDGDDCPRSGGSGGSSTSPAKKASFIICEICDCYTRDVSELQSHMLNIHGVS